MSVKKLLIIMLLALCVGLLIWLLLIAPLEMVIVPTLITVPAAIFALREIFCSET